MAERAEHRPSIEEHPDVVGLQRQFGQTLGSPQTVLSEGVLSLAGVWAAISPWVIGFDLTNPAMMTNNLIIGLVVAALGLGVTGTAERSSGLTWVAVPLGAWLIIATWIVPAGGPSMGLIWNNVVTGAVVVLVGAAVAGVNLFGMRRDMLKE